jgi:hypothetical protein
MSHWTPEDIARITTDVDAIPDLQQRLLANDCADMKVPDRVAHQYQIAGGRISLQISAQLPSPLEGVGLFKPGAQYTGIARISTGMGCPHHETSPDFLGLRLAFLTDRAERVDFIGLNHPAAPTDTPVEFMKLLAGTAASAGQSFLTSVATMEVSLAGSLGAVRGTEILAHVTKQTARTALSSTAYQTYWTGVVETGGHLGKCVIAPAHPESSVRDLTAGAHYLTEEWRTRQAKGPIEFQVYWIPFIDEDRTPLLKLTGAWTEERHLIGIATFPAVEYRTEEAVLWSALAAEMGANPGNWVRDRSNSIPLPETEFGLARKIAYQKSQEGRGVLPEAQYLEVFSRGTIGAALAAELRRRREMKRALGHVDTAG